LHELGFHEVRVRHHGATASIEVPVSEIQRLASLLEGVTEAFRAIGFAAVRVASDGLRSGRFSAQFVPAGDTAPVSGGHVP
ncbi:MAG TPA: ATP-binding protein, partial [bacterium]|nr:ATP-binding protein [bacterium]